MARTTNLSRPIIEALYTEALVLADEVRAVFAAGTREPVAGEDAFVRLALSTEGLKTTTRMMHVLAWLLNQRALFLVKFRKIRCACMVRCRLIAALIRHNSRCWRLAPAS